MHVLVLKVEEIIIVTENVRQLMVVPSCKVKFWIRSHWIRTRMPKRVWKRCMEFKIKTEAGKLETYFIDRRTGTAHKVRVALKPGTWNAGMWNAGTENPERRNRKPGTPER